MDLGKKLRIWVKNFNSRLELTYDNI